MANSYTLSAPIAYGRTSEIYDWGSEQVLKLYHVWCPPSWIEKEARVARAITEAGIPAPAAGEIVEVGARRGIVYERVRGRSMLEEMNRRPWLLLRYARMLAELQAGYHALSVPDLEAYRQGLERAIRHAPGLPDPVRDRVLALLETLPEDTRLCHGDFHPGNVIMSPRGPLVIDWMTAGSGNRWADVARTSLLLTIGVRSAGKQVRRGFRLLVGLYHRAYLGRYAALAADRQDPAEVNRWMPVIAAARLNEQIEMERGALLEMVEAK